jgi:hypothetical protein
MQGAFGCNLLSTDDIKALILWGKNNRFGKGIYMQMLDKSHDWPIQLWVQCEVVESVVAKVKQHGLVVCHAVVNYLESGFQDPEQKLIMQEGVFISFQKERRFTRQVRLIGGALSIFRCCHQVPPA